MPPEEDPLDRDKTINSLRLNNQRLSKELKGKEKLLQHFMEVAYKQSQQISTMNLALNDTIIWDPLTCPRPSSCSTPNPTNQSSWVDVIARGNQRSHSESAAPGPVLSNRFALLMDDDAATSPAVLDTNPPGAVASINTAPVGPAGSSSPPHGNRHELRDRLRDIAQKERASAKTAAAPSSSRRRLLEEAVRRRSGGLPRSNSAENPPVASGGSSRPHPVRSPPVCADPSAAAVRSRPLSSHALPRSSAPVTGHGSPPLAATSTSAPPGSPPPSESASLQSPAPHPRPLFAQTSLLIGDSLIRNCRFFNATTHCIPGATVRTLLDKLPGILQTAPPTITRIIIHVGTNETSRRQSELTRHDFKELFNFLSLCGKTVFISGVIPTLARGDERFSRLRDLHTWLKNTSSNHNFGFIDNFNLFWCRSSFFKTDGVHINSLGNRFLTANIQYSILSHNSC